MGVRIKICGITNLEDAAAAVQAGADALGFVFSDSSPRHVGVSQAANIIRELPPLVSKVGVFVDSPADFIESAARESGLDTLQFHGDEPPEFCRLFSLKTIKAFRVRDAASLAEITTFHTSAWLLDSFVPGLRGGSGACFNWDLARDSKSHGRPIILAGGLTPDNIASAIAHVRPYGVDVSSGVELKPGIKDHAKLKAFIEKARESAAETTE